MNTKYADKKARALFNMNAAFNRNNLNRVRYWKRQANKYFMKSVKTKGMAI